MSVTSTAGKAMIVALSCIDSSGAAVTYALDSNPAHGSLSAFNAGAGQVTYRPAGGYTGPDSFRYHAASVNGIAAAQAVSITVMSRPMITHASMSNKRFRVGPGVTAISTRKAPPGTSFRFSLSTPARVRIAITRSAPGLRKGRGCVAAHRATEARTLSAASGP